MRLIGRNKKQILIVSLQLITEKLDEAFGKFNQPAIRSLRMPGKGLLTGNDKWQEGKRLKRERAETSELKACALNIGILTTECLIG